MDDLPSPRPTQAYVAVVCLAAVAIGTLIGLGVGFIVQSILIGLGAGLLAAVLVGSASVVAVRRRGGGTVEGAPPYTGHAGDRGFGSV